MTKTILLLTRPGDQIVCARRRPLDVETVTPSKTGHHRDLRRGMWMIQPDRPLCSEPRRAST